MPISELKTHQPFNRDSLIYTFQIEVSGLELIRSIEAGGVKKLITSALAELLETEFNKTVEEKHGNK